VKVESVPGARARTASPQVFLGRWWVLITAALIALGAAILAPATFSWGSLRNMMIQIAPLGLVAIGQFFVILVGGLDLSVASVMATAAVIATSFGGANVAMPEILVATIAMAACVGLINGLLVTKRGVEPFLVTLASMIVLQGVRSAYTRGVPLGVTPPLVRALGTGNLGGVPIGAIVLMVVAAILALMMWRSTLGRRIYIVGNSPAAANLLGINAAAVTVFCYVLCSVLAAAGGLVLAGYLEQVDNWVGKGYELDSIVAAVLGGVVLGGGRGMVFGALGGSVLLIFIANFVLQLGYPIQLQMIIKGVVVLFAVAVYARRRVSS
jgi:ribose/xylose/arabinose/galactoside ABC-type transport system permease subunit